MRQQPNAHVHPAFAASLNSFAAIPQQAAAANDAAQRAIKCRVTMRAEAGMTAQHTPGPWNSFNEYGNRGGCFAADNETLIACYPRRTFGDTHREPTEDEMDANFHLIDAAPDLLIALEGLLPEAERFCASVIPREIAAARAAIAKAKGGRA